MPTKKIAVTAQDWSCLGSTCRLRLLKVTCKAARGERGAVLLHYMLAACSALKWHWRRLQADQILLAGQGACS